MTVKRKTLPWVRINEAALELFKEQTLNMERTGSILKIRCDHPDAAQCLMNWLEVLQSNYKEEHSKTLEASIKNKQRHTEPGDELTSEDNLSCYNGEGPFDQGTGGGSRVIRSTRGLGG